MINLSARSPTPLIHLRCFILLLTSLNTTLAVLIPEIFHPPLFDAHQTKHISLIVVPLCHLLPSPCVPHHSYQLPRPYPTYQLLHLSKIRVQGVWH